MKAIHRTMYLATRG